MGTETDVDYAVHKNVRYDRQLRLWGDHGQLRLEQAHVCLLNATAVGTEILKSLVLPGVGAFTIIDGSKATGSDVGRNFFLESTSLDHPRGRAACELLKELNPNVAGHWVNEAPEKLPENNLGILEKFTVVIGTGISEKTASLIGDFLWTRDIPFILVRPYGIALFSPSLYCLVPLRTIWTICAVVSFQDSWDICVWWFGNIR